MIPLPLVKIIGVILALVALIGVIVGAYKLVDSKGYARGQAETNASWQARESRELAAANALILLMEEKARRQERDASAAITKANENRRIADAKAQLLVKNAARDVAAGLGRLCEPAGDTAREGAGERAEGGSAATAERPHGTDRAELYAEFANFLSTEAARADAITRRLIEAQAYIRTALETCNAP